jgi:hypothetical protein
MEFEEISDEEAAAEITRLRSKPQHDAYEELIALLKDGGAARIPVTDDSEVAGKRIALGHRATKQRMQLAFGYNPDRKTLTVRKVHDLTEEDLAQRTQRSPARKQQSAS